jgi:methionyl-tRNA synthetase
MARNDKPFEHKPMKKVYITTSIPYVNAAPHVGFAMELCQADALARYYRGKLGEDQVFLLTGTDEHGLKVQQSAKEAGVSEKEFTDQVAAKFQKLAKGINFSADNFIRTTDPHHYECAKELWRLCSKDIYKKKYKALYCPGCEEFKTEKDLVNGCCPNHQGKIEEVEEENYFFKLSDYAPRIKELIESDELKITPLSRKNEVLNWLAEGVEDVSISRETSRLKWGIPVPGDDSQVMYVWVDALSNYLSGIGFPEKKYQDWWNEEATKIHIIGKDILRFHAIIWTGLLLSAGLPLPNEIYAHGHITVNNQKMSKSLGNVIDPFKIIDKYGADPLRYYLLAKIPWDGDGDFTEEKFAAVYKGELADNWGNLLNRLVVLAEKAGISITEEDFKDAKDYIDNLKKLVSRIEQYEFSYLLEVQQERLAKLNKEINDQKPWEIIKTDKNKAQGILDEWLKEFYSISAWFSWATPQIFLKTLDIYKSGKIENLFPRID